MINKIYALVAPWAFLWAHGKKICWSLTMLFHLFFVPYGIFLLEALRVEFGFYISLESLLNNFFGLFRYNDFLVFFFFVIGAISLLWRLLLFRISFFPQWKKNVSLRPCVIMSSSFFMIVLGFYLFWHHISWMQLTQKIMNTTQATLTQHQLLATEKSKEFLFRTSFVDKTSTAPLGLEAEIKEVNIAWAKTYVTVYTLWNSIDNTSHGSYYVFSQPWLWNIDVIDIIVVDHKTSPYSLSNTLDADAMIALVEQQNNALLWDQEYASRVIKKK